MPNRILKESILDSPTLAKLSDFTQDQFPRLLLLADDWGCFNADLDVIKGRAYAKRPQVTVPRLKKVLLEMNAQGLLFLWVDGDRQYGYWVGWDHHNYCNASAVDEEGKQAKHRRRTPPPPLDQLEQYVASVKNKLEQPPTNTLIPIPIPIPPSGNKEINAREELKLGEHGNVRMTEEERQKLIGKFGQAKADEWIDTADLYFGSKGHNNKNDYLSILNWDRMEKKKHAVSGNGNGNGARAPTPRRPTDEEVEAERLKTWGPRK